MICYSYYFHIYTRIFIYLYIFFQIVFKTITIDPEDIVTSLSQTLPVSENCDIPNIKYSNFNNEQILSSASVCVIEETEQRTFMCKWPGVVPTKCKCFKFITS